MFASITKVERFIFHSFFGSTGITIELFFIQGGGGGGYLAPHSGNVSLFPFRLLRKYLAKDTEINYFFSKGIHEMKMGEGK